MADITITRDDDGRHGRYTARIAGIDAEAELTYVHRGAGRISADHTRAPTALRGTGVAAALVERLVADARAQGWQIDPVCSYIAARYAKNPDWQDVMTVPPGKSPAG